MVDFGLSGGTAVGQDFLQPMNASNATPLLAKTNSEAVCCCYRPRVFGMLKLRGLTDSLDRETKANHQWLP